ncbi:MAG: hypothetical protein RMJ98_12955, partial [Myxococcales bacterium]|nr:hypothetical protein [Myxococcales bacterium]
DSHRRPTLYVWLPGKQKPLEEELRKLKSAPDGEVQAALEAASQAAPREVWVKLKGGKRVLSIRLA